MFQLLKHKFVAYENKNLVDPLSFVANISVTRGSFKSNSVFMKPSMYFSYQYYPLAVLKLRLGGGTTAAFYDFLSYGGGIFIPHPRKQC